MIEPEVIVVLEPWDVDPVVKCDAKSQELKQAYRLYGCSVHWPENFEILIRRSIVREIDDDDDDDNVQSLLPHSIKICSCCSIESPR